MTRILILVILCTGSLRGQADDQTSSPAEQYLHSGEFARGESELLNTLDEKPTDDEARFGLGVIQVMRAFENFGQALHEYGAISENTTQPLLRLPVPKNANPSTISYSALGRVLDTFANDLGRAESTLAQIKDDNVRLKLRLAKISFNFTGTGHNRTNLLVMIQQFFPRQLPFAKTNPEFRVHFDRGDVAWLRGYCHLLSAIVDAYRSMNMAPGFNKRAGDVFPKTEASKTEDDDDWRRNSEIVDPPRLRRLRLHLVAVCELNHETWKHIRQETDDDFEWLPHPKQSDQLNLPFTDQRIDAWLTAMGQLEILLKGECLIPSSLLDAANLNHPPGQGLNFRKLFDSPPADFNFDRVQANGINPIYLEDQKSKPELNLNAFMQMAFLFNDPSGFAHGFRLN